MSRRRVRRRFGIAGLVLIAAQLVSVSAPALTSQESELLRLTNSERSRDLAHMSELSRVARRHSHRMAEDGTIYHNRRLGSEIPPGWCAAGENVGMGPDVQTIHDAFMGSPGHRANIEDPDYTHIGVGVVEDSEDTVYATVVFACYRSRRAPPRPRRPVDPQPFTEPPRPPRPVRPPPPPPPDLVSEAYNGWLERIFLRLLSLLFRWA